MPKVAEALAFFSRQDKNIVRGVYRNKRDRAENIISEASTTPSFGEGRGVYSKKTNLKLAQSGASPCIFFSDRTQILLGVVSKEKRGGGQ